MLLVGERLVGVGYVDALPQGLSAIYFFYEPDERGRSLGTYNVLRILAGAATRQLPHVYLGYYVAGCRSLPCQLTARFNYQRTAPIDTIATTRVPRLRRFR